MVFPKARLVVSASLFIGWISFLVYLVARTRDPVILSRPQLQVSSLLIVAEVREKVGRPDPAIMVKNVVRSVAAEDGELASRQLGVEGLADCGSRQGWTGPGEYIVPLTKRKVDNGFAYQVTTIPLSPNYPRHPPDYVPDFVTIELISIGPEREKVAELVGTLIGRPKNLEVAKGIQRRNVPWLEANEFKKQLEAAKAVVRFREEESRIYLATTDALEQLQVIK